MSIETCMIWVGVNIYLLVYVCKTVQLLKNFYNAIGHCEGQIISEDIIKNIKRKKEKNIKISVPIYQFILNGKRIQFKSLVSYRDLKTDEKVSIVFDEEKEMFWCERDIQVLRKNLIMKVLMMEFLLILMVLVDLTF